MDNEQRQKIDSEKLRGLIENILFTAGESVAIANISSAIGVDAKEIETFLDEEIPMRQEGYGLLILRLEDHLQMATRPEYIDMLRSMFGPKNEEELTKTVLETLSIIAYKQPVTRGEIEEIRGVKSSYTVNTLLEKGLIEEAGRKESLGRPILYKTSENFLRQFGLSSMKDLPQVEYE